jgi:putative phosphoribosyl transferase
MEFQCPFRDREHAGRELAQRLGQFSNQSPIVLGLTRGGVPVAYELARALRAPLDVWVVRKLGAPIQPELGMGAVSEGGEVLVDAHIIQEIGASDAEVQEIVSRKTAEVEERCARYRRGRSSPNLEGKTVLLVDDGIATGGTARAALRAIRRHGPRRVVLATPVASPDTLEDLAQEADEIVCVSPQPELDAIGLWYESFETVEDDDVVAILDKAQAAGSRRNFAEANVETRPGW